MITTEEAYLINKVYVLIYSVILIYGVKAKTIEKTEMILLPCLMVGTFSIYYILQHSSFQDFYLYDALNCLSIVVVSLFVHNERRVNHSKSVYFIYGLLLFKFLMYMVIYRVRVIIYDTDAPIMWLINTQSVLILLCDSLIVLILSLQVSKWKLRFMQFS